MRLTGSALKKLFLALLLAAFAAAAWWVYRRSSELPEVAFTRVRSETLVSTLPTNGKVEPAEWQPVRADAPGLIEKLAVHEGQSVAEGAVIAELARPGVAAEIAAAQARVEQARADLAVVERGGRPAELAEIESSLLKQRTERDAAGRELEALQRLQARQAATGADVEAARTRVRQIDLEIEALDRRRKAIAAGQDKTASQARLREAEAALALARSRAAQSVIRAPIAGIVYGLAVRPGAYLQPGELIANVGRLETVRVRVYVDEPELGRVDVGQPVVITWDALPGKKWTGAVERKPSSIVALGSRQVGEVLCSIPNPGRELIPGTNVNAEIRTSTVRNALTIPKEALRREGGVQGVFVLRDGKLAWQPVTVGVTSITRAQVSGVAEGDPVALPGERPLRSGEAVKPLYL